MKLYLFGGAEPNPSSVAQLIQMINDVLAEIQPKQLLHIPYARMMVPEGEVSLWGEGWVSQKLHLDGIELLDARSSADLAKAEEPVIFMNGGLQRDNLYNEIIANPRLQELVLGADYVIGESAGSMVCAQYRRTYRDGKEVTAPGLGILKNTIIEAHYTQRQRHQLLRDEMKQSGARYGIGIDSVTGIVVDTATFPEKYEKIGDGLVELVNFEDL